LNEFWIDVGGTFTDCLRRDAQGQLTRTKVLSSGVTKGLLDDVTASGFRDARRCGDPPQFWRGFRCTFLDHRGQPIFHAEVVDFNPQRREFRFAPHEPAPPLTPGQTYELTAALDAPLLAIRWLLKLPLAEPLPPLAVRLGTTRGTNALLTRRGAKTAFVTTWGFGDILRIGYQNRPRLFDLNIRKSPPLFAASVEVRERLAADGAVLEPLDLEHAREVLLALRAQGFDSLAIALLHAYRHGAHELALEGLARELGFREISLSHRVAPLVKLVARGDTTVVDAYLNPVLGEYVARLQTALGPDSDLRLLTSSGGLVEAQHFRGKDSILSGPAGGVVGFSRVASAAGFAHAIGFDMGGTSTDVARYDGRYELQYETEKAGVRIVSPMLAIVTVAAGGGSLCWFDGVKLCVGPDSAGADPGPACYGRGGPLAVTDLNLWLGKIPPEHFPFALDREAVARELDTLRETISQATGTHYCREELAAGLLAVANANMAQAIRSVSTAQGYDPRDYVLVAFGGAAAQHACAVAEELGIRQILNHPDAGLLSAYGMGLADVVWHEVQGLAVTYSRDALAEIERVAQELRTASIAAVAAQGVARERISTETSLDLRYRGTDIALTVLAPRDNDYAAAFAREHRRRYGYTHDERPLEVVAVRAQAIGKSQVSPGESHRVARSKHRQAEHQQPVYFAGNWRAAARYDRASLQPGDIVLGPAVIAEATSTTVIDPAWRAEVLSGGELLLTFQPADASTHSLALLPGTAADPVQLEIFNHHFAGIAERMGLTLRNTSSSVNVKERLDFSCALFTARGDLVVNAPHIPVHLGAMSETVKQLLSRQTLHPGDVYVTNDPYRGGSHLPDITVITPVHDPDSGELWFVTASRAHHAEIGGITPGSMPPFSKTLAEEGVLIRDFLLVARGTERFAALGEHLANAPYPSRNVADNLADIAAQVAANQQGTQDLAALVERYGWPVVSAYMQHIQAAAETKMRAALAKLPDGRREFVDHLDDGTPIQVALTIAGDDITIDFTGAGPVSRGNLNANRAIVTAAIMYVLRLLIDEDIPLNQGVLAPVSLVLPEGILNPPEKEHAADCPAVVGGNVETSQRVVDVLLGALGLAAASQGTMNNLLFGDDRFGYYETICGGSGATPTAAGADAVHTHMTNTRLTDPEILELRYPVRLTEFRIRANSGGAGAHPGGRGVVRKLEFLKPLQVSILSERRAAYAPYGLGHGSPGARGRNTLLRASGATEQLPGAAHLEVAPGDTLILETPGGGGWSP
jgi:5-oxoprolinase (ATP-hydrolysing)